MLLKTIKNWLKTGTARKLRETRKEPDFLSQASELNKNGKFREAIDAYKKYLQHHPADAVAINNLGVCHANIGDTQEAHRLFELAYLLDDSQTPAVVNHAKFLSDQKRGAESYDFLRRARALEPEFRHIDAIYASLCMNSYGDVNRSRYFQLRAWNGNFDTLRYANSYLFYTSYDDIKETELAAEHHFWAETLKPVMATTEKARAGLKASKKIRIGYWSPDFRNHSVRYFFRPLQENHDRENFEIFIYHDSPTRDEQTGYIEDSADAFYTVFELTDEELNSLLLSHRLDILVELAGHTSHNRINLLQQRLAKFSITALGYPPTTGLNTINAKLLDEHILTKDYALYYSENPLTLPSSFWCFDPIESEPPALAAEPPVIKNGYVTFAYVGNIAKINLRIIECWSKILRRIPRSQLLIRSINFADPIAANTLRTRLENAGIPGDRLNMRQAEGGKAFFDSYNEIDIILDTYPFNGGTTTCFAVYMGTPVVTWAGESLISRMGLSILTNVRAADLVTHDADSYVHRAVALSQDISYLKRFKKESRKHMQLSALGNGKIFAWEFEQACIKILSEQFIEGPKNAQKIDILPAEEVVRRAYDVLNHGNIDAAKRILNYCLKYYPDNGSAHILYANAFEGERRHAAIIQYLTEQLERFNEDDRCAALITIARNFILQQLPEKAARTVKRLGAICPSLILDQRQVQLYQAYLGDIGRPTPAPATTPPRQGRLHCVIPCDDLERFETIQKTLSNTCWQPAGWAITYERCKESQRIKAYSKASLDQKVDILLFLQKNVDVYQPKLFFEIISTLNNYDMMGYAGARRWKKLDWVGDSFELKAGSMIIPSSEKDGFYEIMVFGSSQRKVQGNIQVLAGELIALRREKFSLVPLNNDFEGAEYMIEQAWSNDFFQAGGRLAVHQGLGLMPRIDIVLDRRYWGSVRLDITEARGFELFETKRPDLAVINMPTPTVQDAICVMETYFK